VKVSFKTQRLQSIGVGVIACGKFAKA
jgi:hypothetical protein